MQFKALQLLMLVCIMVTSGGCAGLKRWWRNGLIVGPNYRRPFAQTSPDWIDGKDPSVTRDCQPLNQWWTIFGDPTLDELVQVAYQQNLSVRAARLRILEARAQRRITAANLLPQSQTAFGQYTRTQVSRTTATASPLLPRAFDDWQNGFDLSWELDVWGRIRRAIEASDAAIGAEIANYDDILVTLIGDVAATYIELRALDERIRLAEANVAIQQESLNIAEIRLKEEEVSELDVQQARANVRATAAAIPALKQGRRQAINSLAILLGTTPYDLEPLLRAEGTIPSTPTQAVVGIPADLLRRRPDIRRSEREVAIQSAQIGIAESELYPRFALGGQIFVNAEKLDDLFQSDSVAGAIAPGFSWKILNYGRLIAGIEVERLQFQQAVLGYENTVLNAQREVEDAIAQFLRSTEQAAELQQAVDATERSVELVIIQYKEGATDFNQVFVLESNLANLQDQLTVARLNIAIGLVQVYKAIGGGWQIRLNNPQSRPDVQGMIDADKVIQSDEVELEMLESTGDAT